MNNLFGLLSPESDAIPLMGVKVEGEILGRGARVVVSQRFKNQEEKPVEAVYKFPLPEGSAICGFKARVNGKIVHGEVEERERAFEIYDDALAEGDGGMLLDEERPNIFTLSVGNLNPAAEAVIETEYVTLLDMEGKKMRFSLPTSISPRYLPDDTEDDNGIPVDGRLHPTYAPDVPYGISISLDIHKGSFLQSIASPSHQIKVDNLKSDPVRVTLSQESVRMDRDFILYMEYEDTLPNRAYRYEKDGESFLQLDLCLAEAEEEQDASGKARRVQEIIFVLDCSGSMSGDSIREAKKALEICLRGLDQGTLFNLYRFGSSFEHLFPRSEKYTEKSMEQALRYLNAMDADLGGTEILEPLKHIYSSRGRREGTTRNIILLTDGEVGNEEEILELVKKNRKSTRMFSLGIGAGPNDYFIRGISRAGRGAHEFIYPGERIEPKVLRVFGKVNHEGLIAPFIDWGKKEVEQSPTELVIFRGMPATVFARSKGEGFSSSKVKLKGKLEGQNKEWEIDVVESDGEHLPIPVLWARERIRDIEESPEVLGVRGSRQTERKQDQWKDTVIGLSKKYGILSQSTSYVAIEEREEEDKTTGELVLRKVPALVTVGWHGMGGVFGLEHADAMYKMPAAPAMIEESRVMSEMSIDRFAASKADYEVQASLEFDSDHKTDIVLAILSLQRAEGGIELNEEVSELLGIHYTEVMERSRRIKFEMELEKFRYLLDMGADSFLILSTAVLLRTLEIHFSSEREMWVAPVRKSRDWMMHVIHEGRLRIEGRELMTWVEEFVRGNIRI